MPARQITVARRKQDDRYVGVTDLALDRLAQLETELPPIDVMFLYKIIDWTGDLGDRAQQVGSRLELLLAR